MSQPDASPSLAATSPISMLVRVSEGARLLGMTQKALRHRIARGQIPIVRIGGSVFIRRADLVRLVTEGRGLSPGSR
jgi:hypothetical protein